MLVLLKRVITGALLCVNLLLVVFVITNGRVERSLDSRHFMSQINVLRSDNDLLEIERNPQADILAEYIYHGDVDLFEVLRRMEELGLSAGGQYPVYWEMHVRTSVADQINELPLFEQGFFVNPDVLYWGHYIDRDTQDYLLVLILANPLYEELDERLPDPIRGDYEHNLPKV